MDSAVELIYIDPFREMRYFLYMDYKSNYLSNYLSNLSLKTKLLFMMLSLFFLTLTALFVLYGRAEKDLVEEVRHHTEEVSSAIQVSIEEMSKTAQGRNINALKDLTRFRKKGITEISVMNNVREVIASSNPRLIGRKLHLKGESIKNVGNLTEYTTATGTDSTRYDLLLPVTVGKDMLGYIHISTEFEDIADIARSNHRKRLVTTLVIFSIGILAAIYLSNKYTRPIESIAEGAQRVAAGDLSVKLDIEKVDNEVGRLMRTFNDMVKKLNENRTLEVRLKEAEHLSKIGTLASGIAHEIRNPLNLINLSIDHLRTINTPDDPEKKEVFLTTIASIKSEIQRLDGMVTNFLNFGKPLNLTFADISLAQIVDETVMLLSDSCEEQNISIEVRKNLHQQNIRGDYRHIKTCLMNMFLNSMQAMPDGGRIIAELGSRDGFATVSIIDNGCGIPPENLARIFDPYFTTKDVGIGLGLALTKRIVEEHGGAISVESAENEGTTITMNLPVERRL